MFAKEMDKIKNQVKAIVKDWLDNHKGNAQEMKYLRNLNPVLLSDRTEDYFKYIIRAVNDGYEPLKDTVMRKVRADVLKNVQEYNKLKKQAANAAAEKASASEKATYSVATTLSDPKSILVTAILAEDIATIEKMAKEVVDIEAALDEEGNTSLHFACLHNKTASLRKLIQLGASLKAHNRNGEESLQLAARNGFAPIIIELIMAGASIEDKTGKIKSKALTEAIVHKQLSAVKLLIAVDAQISDLSGYDDIKSLMPFLDDIKYSISCDNKSLRGELVSTLDEHASLYVDVLEAFGYASAQTVRTVTRFFEMDIRSASLINGIISSLHSESIRASFVESLVNDIKDKLKQHLKRIAHYTKPNSWPDKTLAIAGCGLAM